jgi:hypothetical protein
MGVHNEALTVAAPAPFRLQLTRESAIGKRH